MTQNTPASSGQEVGQCLVDGGTLQACIIQHNVGADRGAAEPEPPA